MVSDRIGDFIVRLQNAVMISKQEVRVPHSNHLEAIARKLKDLGFLTSVEVRAKEEGSTIKTLIVGLAYNERGEARLHGVKRVSKPGRRLYAGVADALLSTSAGVLSDAEARKQKVGGEELFEIW
jgi:small subunit ribosomal protein S8